MQERNKFKEILTGGLKALELIIEEVESDKAEVLAGWIMKSAGVFVTGQGRSGLIANCFVTRLAQMGFQVHVPGYANCRRITSSDVFIAVSCSGRRKTATFHYAEIAKNAGAQVACITGAYNNDLARISDFVVVLPSRSEKVINATPCRVGPMNNTVFEQAVLIYLDSIVVLLLEKLNKDPSLIEKTHTNLE